MDCLDAAVRRQTRFALGIMAALLAPVGLLGIDGQELAPLNLGSGPGNFYQQPNGACASPPQLVVFVISCKDALYLDGSISSIYSRRSALLIEGGEVGPIVGVVRQNAAR
jgi:uncharacterized protein YigE (DUF2233 family)